MRRCRAGQSGPAACRARRSAAARGIHRGVRYDERCSTIASGTAMASASCWSARRPTASTTIGATLHRAAVGRAADARASTPRSATMITELSGAPPGTTRDRCRRSPARPSSLPVQPNSCARRSPAASCCFRSTRTTISPGSASGPSTTRACTAPMRSILVDNGSTRYDAAEIAGDARRRAGHRARRRAELAVQLRAASTRRSARTPTGRASCRSAR